MLRQVKLKKTRRRLRVSIPIKSNSVPLKKFRTALALLIDESDNDITRDDMLQALEDAMAAYPWLAR